MSEAMTTPAATAPVKPPMRTLEQDFPMHHRRIGPRGPQYQPENDQERRLLAMFRIWMHHPQERIPLLELSHMMLSHEIRSYTKNTQPQPPKKEIQP